MPQRLLPAVLLLKASALALREVPQLNGIYADGAFRPGDGIHVGWAISLRGGGLLAPAIRDTDTLALSDLMAAMRDLVQRARTGGLRSSELASPTITVTSLGDRGAETVTGIIYPPQVAIIGFGTIETRPWVVNGRGHSAAAGDRQPCRRSPRERRAYRRSAVERDRTPTAGAGKAMTETEARGLIYEILSGIAPEADPATVAGDADLREALDLDSMDFMNFIVALHERTGIDIPEADYPEFYTFNGVLAYLGR